MLEWYRAGESYESLMMDCVRILALAAETTKTAKLFYRGRECDPFNGPVRISVADAFRQHADIDLLASVCADGSTDRDHLAAEVRRVGMRVADDDGWADLFSRALVEKVEPHLGFGQVTILDEYPVCEAALARPSARDPRVAERFEVYACGVELANGFGELTNPVEQRRRFEIEMAEKARIYGEVYPIDEDFLDALSIMPEASGIALGFDRLVMLATGASRIDQVLWAPVAEYGR
jgi:lysyl-tRNA synthetase class 2